MYPELFGGAVALSRDQFKKIRGFSNVFFGWGGEDDDLYYRVKHHRYEVFRHVSQIARYTMIKHERDVLNPANPERLVQCALVCICCHDSRFTLIMVV